MDSYQKFTQQEHVLNRPDMYVGSVQLCTEKMWVYDIGKGMDYRKIEFVPALFKIFDEIIMNAAIVSQKMNY